MDGLFLENGPFRVKKDLSLSINKGGWQKYATNFMDKLYDIFPKLRQQDLYIAGESFAGSYIPYFANRILKLNRERDQPFRLKGIAIGNGWISAKHQHGLVSDDRMDLIESHFKECQQDIANKETIHISSCEKVLTDVTDSNVRENKDMKKVCLNVYDIRMKDEPYPECGLSWPYELADVTRYLRLDEVKRAIHAEKQSLGWKECTSLVSIELNGDESRSSYYLLPDILEEIPLAGYVTRDRNLTYVMIKDGSHMVPYDKPTECLDMINRFIQVEHGQADNKGKEKPSDKEKEEEEEEEEDKPSDKDTKQEDEKQTIEQEPTNERSKYYSWGIGVFVVVLFVALALCCWCFGSRRPSPTAKFGGAPQREREGVRKLGVIGHLKNLFSRKTNNRKIFRLGDQDETNELDELVVETPTLFEAEENFEESQPGPEGSKPSDHHHFTIDDEHDDEEESDFDFADWDEESTLRKNKK
ncbi:alpha/beta-hydrolase [Rhizopus microsporus]|uniref:Pheromone-processing carboxypeptidase KEX1 n=1 Tax=Rhizopus microsporus TaxID=58291 RepID=A0A1X0RUS2_RHIZD|nr:alpha/beta-hydrolase [Rhizopus microsporus]